MSHVLPPLGHPAREMFDVSDLVAIGTGNALPLSLQAAKARGKTVCRDSKGIIRRVCFIVIRASGALELISVGARGGHRTEWEFSA